MAALHILAVLGVLSADMRLALHACSAMPERVEKWQRAVLHNLAALIVLSAVVRLALYACHPMPLCIEKVMIKNKVRNDWSNK
jgi:CO/xanthine dehydrogenase FAD-binding subunit